MKSEAGLAVSYLRTSERHQFFVGAPANAVSRVHLPDDDAKGRFVTAVLKAKCGPGEELELYGEPVAKLSGEARAALRRRIGAVSPIVGLITNLNAWENISLVAAYEGSPPLDRVAALTQEVLAAFDIEPRPLLARLPEELGMLERKIVSFIRLLVRAPELALIDALDAGLSRAERNRAAAFETQLSLRLPGATVLFVDSREEAS